MTILIIKILVTIMMWIIFHFLTKKIEKFLAQIDVIPYDSKNDYKLLLIGDIGLLIIVLVFINKIPIWSFPIIYIGGFFGGHWGDFTNYAMHGSKWWEKKKKKDGGVS